MTAIELPPSLDQKFRIDESLPHHPVPGPPPAHPTRDPGNVATVYLRNEDEEEELRIPVDGLTAQNVENILARANQSNAGFVRLTNYLVKLDDIVYVTVTPARETTR